MWHKDGTTAIMRSLNIDEIVKRKSLKKMILTN